MRVAFLDPLEARLAEYPKRYLANHDVLLEVEVFSGDSWQMLVANPGRVVEKDELIKTVWPDTFVEDGALARNPSLPSALTARIDNELARSAAGTASASDGEEALLIAKLSAPAAGRALRWLLALGDAAAVGAAPHGPVVVGGLRGRAGAEGGGDECEKRVKRDGGIGDASRQHF